MLTTQTISMGIWILTGEHFLTRVGEPGIVLSPQKIKFSKKTIKFSGFGMSSDNIEPLPRYLDAIASLPTPQNSPDGRSCYGLSKVSSYAQQRGVLTPIGPFWSPNTKFQ